MTLPPGLTQAVLRALKRHEGTELTLKASLPVGGGDINRAAKLVLGDGRTLFVKYNPQPLPELFECEARGLERLRRTGTVPTPQVLAVGPAGPDHPAFLLMEWIEPQGTRSEEVMSEFGRQLARLHQHTAAQYGLDHDNYIGSLPQWNAPCASWVAFYRDRRLAPQGELARRQGRLPAPRARLLERLMDRLSRLLDEASARPALLHGDLWGGNYLLSERGAVVIDPAVYHGDREVELAFTELFGGFPEPFYRGYAEVWPLDAAYPERRALYQLYPLLVHLNLFGEPYGRRVDRILVHYVG